MHDVPSCHNIYHYIDISWQHEIVTCLFTIINASEEDSKLACYMISYEHKNVILNTSFHVHYNSNRELHL